MPKRKDISRLAKASHWIAENIGWVVGLAARGANTNALLDAEARLALALEAYGEVLRDGDMARVEVALEELEIRLGESRRPRVRHEYDDPIGTLEWRRRTRRKVDRLRRRVDHMTAEGASGRSLRDARQELAFLEGLVQ